MNYYSLFLLIALLFNLLSADLIPYLKKSPGKEFTPRNQVKNIDFIYLLNLDPRPEKYQLCLDQLAPYNITPYRFSAVCGWELPFSTLDAIGVKYQPWMAQNFLGTCYLPENNFFPLHEVMHMINRTYFFHHMSRGAIGIVLSHLSILHDALQSDYETIWVMEDDIQVIQDPHLLSKRINELDALVGKSRWDILFTDPDTKGKNGQYVPCLSYAERPNFSPDNPGRFAQIMELPTT
jgi:hypothetical protein